MNINNISMQSHGYTSWTRDESVMHGQCDARPTVTFPAIASPPLAGTKLYCLVTEAHVCEQLAQGRYMKVERPGVELATCKL